MLVFRGVLVFLVLAAPAVAAPVPPPPDGFGGTQYVDGTGCVFQRDQLGWQPYLDGRGEPICGFPPTMSYRTDGPTDAQPADIQDRLFQQLSEELRDGEFVADRRAAEPRDPPPPAAPSAIQHDIEKRLANSEALKSSIAGGTDNGLCALLGYRAEAQDGLRYDRDVTQGLCAGMSAPIPSPKFGSVRIVPPIAANARPPEAPPSAATVVGDRPANVPASRPKPVAKPQTEKPKAPQAGPEMVPPHARYVQVGAYRDPADAAAVARRLTGAGYKVGRIRQDQPDDGPQLITVGPFADRQALIRALAQLRADGFSQARAR